MNVSCGAIVDLVHPVVKGRGLVVNVDETRPYPVAVRIGRRTVWAKHDVVRVVFAASHPIARLHSHLLG